MALVFFFFVSHLCFLLSSSQPHLSNWFVMPTALFAFLCGAALCQPIGITVPLSHFHHMSRGGGSESEAFCVV